MLFPLQTELMYWKSGSITLEGKADDLLHNEAVQKAYLGE